MNSKIDYSPLVSIVIPTYHRDKELKRAVISIINQDYHNLEVLIVDDNVNEEWSKKVSEIVSSIDSSFPIVLIKNNNNMGSAGTRNVGIENAHGEYICFLDDDDYYLENRIRKQLELMIEEDADYSITDLVLYRDDDKVEDVRKRWYLNTEERENLLLCHLKYHMTGTDTLMFKKDYLLKIGMFDIIDIGDEYYLMLKAIENGGKFVYLPRCDVKSYVHFENASLSCGLKKIQGENILFESKKKYFSEITRKNQKRIIMRHYAVIAYTYLKEKKYFEFFKYMVKSFCSSPVSCIKMYRSHH